MTTGLISQKVIWNPCQCWVWIRFRTVEAMDTLGVDNAYLSYIFYSDNREKNGFGRFSDVEPNPQQALLNALIAGQLHATGLEGGKGQTIEIPKIWWRNAQLSSLNPSEARQGTPQYKSIQLEASEVRRLWPAMSNQASSEAGIPKPNWAAVDKKSEAAELAIRHRYEQRIPQKLSAKAKEELNKLIHDHCPDYYPISDTTYLKALNTIKSQSRSISE